MAAIPGGEIERKIDSIAQEVGEVKVLIAGMMPRAEVDGELARRVSLDAYTSDQRQVVERLTKLEASPQRLLAWIAGVGGCLGVLVAVSSLVFTIIVFVVTHK